jgi:hypothetical protein
MCPARLRLQSSFFGLLRFNPGRRNLFIMKVGALFLCLFLGGLPTLFADLTIIEKVEGIGPPSTISIKIKGDRLRVEPAPDMATIFNAGTGEMLQMLKSRKVVIRFSAGKIKAATELMEKPRDKAAAAPAKAKMIATGKKENVGGYEAEEYVTDTPAFKASYWVVRNYPDGAAIFRQLQSIKPPNWDFAKMGIPDFTELPGLPIKTVMLFGGSRVTTTITSIKQDPLDETEFAVPADFKEVQMPEVGTMLQGESKEPAVTASPEP